MESSFCTVSYQYIFLHWLTCFNCQILEKQPSFITMKGKIVKTSSCIFWLCQIYRNVIQYNKTSFWQTIWSFFQSYDEIESFCFTIFPFYFYEWTHVFTCLLNFLFVWLFTVVYYYLHVVYCYCTPRIHTLQPYCF